MADDNKIQAQAAANAPAKVAETVANTAETLVKESAKTQKRERAASQRRAKRAETADKAARKTTARRTKATVRKTRAATASTTRNTRTAARNTAAAAQQGMDNVTTNFFNGFDAVPAFAPFQSMFANLGERGQQLGQRSQRVSEELADLTRANVEAVVEASRVATERARSLGQDVVASSRDGVEQAADAIRALAEAKSPTEYMQLQGDFARASFDRMVAESSRFTETMVKLAGEAFQPISNRATANAERFNTLVA
jgi:phasin family protein